MLRLNSCTMAAPDWAGQQFDVGPACRPSMSSKPSPWCNQLMCRERSDEAAAHQVRAHVTATRPAQTSRGTPPLPGARDELGQLLHETARLLHRHCEGAVRARLPGMTCARCVVLLQLAQHRGLNQAAIARSLDIAPITLVRLLDRLEAAGLIARLPDPDDRRAYLLTPTAKAQPLIACIRDFIRMIETEAWLGLSSTEINQLYLLLCRLRSNLLIGPNQTLSADPAQDPDHA